MIRREASPLYRVFARVMIVAMLWNTAAFAQQTTSSTTTATGSEVRTDTTAPSAADPYFYDYRTGRRLMVGLDAPIDPDTYIVGPTDQFMLYIRGPKEITVRLPVLPEGTVQLPNVGSLQVAGRTITEMRALIDKRLAPYYRNVQIDCQLVLPRTIVVNVLGEVTNPGPVEIHAPFRLDLALSRAGGVRDEGSHRAIEIIRDGQVVRRADYASFLLLGDLDQNPMLHEGLTVYVPSRGPACSVIGEVWRGGTYEILPGETAADMIRMAGGFTPNAIRDRMVLERLDMNEQLSVSEFDSTQADSVTVQGRDVVVVPDRNSFPGTQFVRVFGGGGRDGIIHIYAGETIGSFLPRFTRLRRTHDLSRAVIERKEASGEVTYIPVDLEAVIHGDRDQAAITLEPGDVINIPPFETAVYVVGDVVKPGPIDFQRGQTAERYIALAGGPSNGGSIDRLEIISPDGDKRGAGRNATVYRGETILVKQKRSRIFQAVFVSVTSLTSLVLSIIAVSRR